jgi:hypothetical protein
MGSPGREQNTRVIAREASVSAKGIAFLILFSTAAASAASAQQPQPNLEAILIPGMTAWITDSSGREVRTRIVDVSGGIVTAMADGADWRVPVGDVMRVRVRRADSLLNGALIGAGAAVASGLFLCQLTEPWDNCRDDIGPMLRIGAAGAAIGIGVDALVRGRRTIYEAGRASARLSAVPLLARRAGGFRIAISF